MAILVNKNTNVIVQGITGRQGEFHTKLMLDYGTKIVAGVTPGKEGEIVHGIKVYDDVESAVKNHKVDASIVFVPAPFAKDACLEALANEIKLLVIITERIPLHDMLEIKAYANELNAKIVGPNTPGIIAPKRCKLGIMPSHIFKEGNIGVVSRSGTLMYEIVFNMSKNRFGQSTCIGIGGDQVTGMSFVDVLRMFEKDDETKVVVIIGEIGGRAEEDAAEFIKKYMSKPVIAYIAGITAPLEKRMGHAGAIITRGIGRAEDKIRALEGAGVKVAKRPSDIPKLLKEVCM
jgi:succinyl-CoA synthetase alpha subunit